MQHCSGIRRGFARLQVVRCQQCAEAFCWTGSQAVRSLSRFIFQVPNAVGQLAFVGCLAGSQQLPDSCVGCTLAGLGLRLLNRIGWYTVLAGLVVLPVLLVLPCSQRC